LKENRSHRQSVAARQDGFAIISRKCTFLFTVQSNLMKKFATSFVLDQACTTYSPRELSPLPKMLQNVGIIVIPEFLPNCNETGLFAARGKLMLSNLALRACWVVQAWSGQLLIAGESRNEYS